jgi:hypothetical protein
MPIEVTCAGKPGERTHLAANVSQRMTSGSTDVEVLIAVGRYQMLPAFPPDHPLWRYPGSPSTSWPLPLGWALGAFQAQILRGDLQRTEPDSIPWRLSQPRAIGQFSSRRQLQGRWVVDIQRAVGGVPWRDRLKCTRLLHETLGQRTPPHHPPKHQGLPISLGRP